MIIGILKEISPERRVALLPDITKSLIDAGNKVYIESGAGLESSASDDTYLQIGASIQNRKTILEESEIILHIGVLTSDELSHLKKGCVLFGMYQPLFNPKQIHEIAEKGITLFSLDAVPRITRAQNMDVLSSMSTVSGYMAVLTAATHLPRFFPMLMTAAGTIAPAKVLILGAGVAGLQAIATAKRLGAVVEAFDTRPSVKEQVMSLGGKFVEVEGSVEDKAAGGYAVEQSEDFRNRQAQLIFEHAKKSDVVITTALIPGKKAPILINADTVRQMKPGSVIIDIASITGGNCELTEDGKTINVHGVTIIGNSNFPSSMPQDSSRMFGKNIQNFLKLILKTDQLELNFNDEIVAGTCITHEGKITYKPLLNPLNA